MQVQVNFLALAYFILLELLENKVNYAMKFTCFSKFYYFKF